ncbi:MAG: hypothetical protein LM564_01915 [Desulfurococcaceae archaeon]|nr:hypothetical protein [Desulfurococcaceae archaeon]
MPVDSSIVYEDEDIVVYRAPSDEELEKLVKELIAKRGRPLSWKELRKELSGVVGEDRLRKILVRLIERDEIVEMIDGTFGLRGMEEWYIPVKTKKRVRPLVPSKFRKRWGPLIESAGSIAAAIQYLVDMKLGKRRPKPR